MKSENTIGVESVSGSGDMGQAAEDWFDFLVIGAGTAGTVIAARLAEESACRVALMEAGGPAIHPLIAQPAKWPLLQGSEIDWCYHTVPQRHTADRIHAWPRGRVVGGSTALNAMAHVRGHPTDFDCWAEAGCTGWGFADLFPYFLRSEDYQGASSAFHGRAGPVHLMRPEDPHAVTRAYLAAGEEIGLAPSADHNGPQLDGPCLNTLTIKEGRRQTIADAYLGRTVDRPNLKLIANADVLSLQIERGRCTGLRARLDGRLREFRAGTIVLAAGAIGSPVQRFHGSFLTDRSGAWAWA